MDKIPFKNKDLTDPDFPTGYYPINDINLNKMQDNIEKYMDGKFVFFATVEEWEEETSNNE